VDNYFITKLLQYSSKQVTLSEFSDWLDKFIATDDFSHRSNKYINIYKKLKTERDKAIRHSLVEEASQL
jgi:hypothetical protein